MTHKYLNYRLPGAGSDTKILKILKCTALLTNKKL